MNNIIKRIFAVHASIAYLGMITGFGAVIFTVAFFYLLTNGSQVAFLTGCDLCRWALTYLTLVIGPGALAMMGYFYTKSRKHENIKTNH